MQADPGLVVNVVKGSAPPREHRHEVQETKHSG